MFSVRRAVETRDLVAEEWQYGVLRAWPFPNGAGRIIDLLRDRLTFRAETAEILTRDGVRLTVQLGELIGQHLYLRGDFDRAVVDVLVSLARPNDTLLDIGANIGYVSASFLHRVPSGNAVAVEPIPQNLTLLRANLSQFASYSIFPFALSHDDRDGWMDVWPNNLGASRIAKERGPLSIPVKIRSTASVLSELSKVDLMKLDVELHEQEILFAAKEHLRRLKPRAIVFEHEAGDALVGAPLWQLFREIGYNVFAIRKRLTGYNFVEPKLKSSSNYVARPF